MNIRILSLLSVLVLSGCMWGTYDRREVYLEAESIPRVKIPAGLDQPPFEDAMEIPEVQDPRNIAGRKLEVGLPDALNSSYGVDQIVIKKLGDSRWVFLDTPPATVWPKIRQFWQDQKIDLESADPSRGVMETRWSAARGGTADEIFESLKRGVVWSDPTAVAQHKFRLRIEPGIRTGSTEVYLEEKSLPLGVPVRSGNVEWTGVSDNFELEGVVLTSLAYYLGEHINTSQAFSMLASNIGGQRAELVPDRMKPVLKFKLPFDRAWVTVGDALESARISVEDLNRAEANYYVYYDDGEKREAGFFGRLFSGEDEKAPPGMANRYLVHLDSKDNEVQVTILKDADTLAEAGIAEKLLTIIKEYST